LHSLTPKFQESGRSIIEIIAVLVVIAILLIGSLFGFKILRDYLNCKKTSDQIATLATRYKLHKLSAKKKSGQVRLTDFFPEGQYNDPGILITPDNGKAELYTDESSDSFVILASDLECTSCYEIVKMKAYDAIVPTTKSELATFKSNRDTLTLDKIYSPNDAPQKIEEICNCSDSQPLVLIYGGNCGESSRYFFDGKCSVCPKGYTQSLPGTSADYINGCCLNGLIGECGTCGDCKDSICYNKTCVECTSSDTSKCPSDKKYCVNNRCEECPIPGRVCDGLAGYCSEYYTCLPCVNAHEISGGNCQCKSLRIGNVCEDEIGECPCPHGQSCLNDGTGTKRCTWSECTTDVDCPSPMVCVDNHCVCHDNTECPTGKYCCIKSGETLGTCCLNAKLCKDGECSDCTPPSDPGCPNGTCCGGSCCASGAICCASQCCTSACVTVDGIEKCGCITDNDCSGEDEYCDTTQHECKKCTHPAVEKCPQKHEDSSYWEENWFVPSCKKYVKKYCLNGATTDDEIGNVTTPICHETDDNTTCEECTVDSECKKLDDVAYPYFVCRTDGTCGKCIIDADCDGGQECKDGICGCENDTDCEGNVDGTKCLETHICGCKSDNDCAENTDGHNTCRNERCECSDPLIEENGVCICESEGDYWTRFDTTPPTYECCPEGETPVKINDDEEYKCMRICKPGEVPSFAMMLDYSYSSKNTTIGGKIFNNERTNIAHTIVEGIRKINSNIRIGVFRETNNHATSDPTMSGIVCEGIKNGIVIQSFDKGTEQPDLNQNLCAYSCETGRGITCFTDAITEVKKECNANKESTIVFVLSDGVIPENTATNAECDPVNTYIYADSSKSFGLPPNHEKDFTETPDEKGLLDMFSTTLCTQGPDENHRQPKNSSE